jgi:UDP-N-acetylmuramoyl-L-alanyl-D-glutamate--2,6-diaminopimelate ligase
MKLQQLISELDPVNVNGSTNLEITGVVSDSRQVRQGSLFVAVKGLTNDGIDFADDAIRKGAVAVIVAAASGIKSFDSGICSVAVHEPRLALAKAASMFCGKPSEKLDVIGITGTNGKTTTAYLAKKILETDGRKTGLITTVEYLVAGRQIPATRTTPDSPELQGLLAQMVDAKCQSAVM